MRKRCLIIAVIMSIFPLLAFGQELEPYFCTKEGSTLEYVRKFTDGKVKWYHTMKINNVWLSEGKGTITYSSEMKDDKKKPLFDSPAEMTAFVDGGDVSVNIGASMAAVFKAKLGNKIKISSIGGVSTLPSNMSPGDTLPDAFCSIHALGLVMKISVTDRKVIKTERLKTNAGVFDCIVVREKKAEVGMGRRRFTTANTWYCRGYGMIRHDTYNKKGELETSEVLVKL